MLFTITYTKPLCDYTFAAVACENFPRNYKTSQVFLEYSIFLVDKRLVQFGMAFRDPLWKAVSTMS